MGDGTGGWLYVYGAGKEPGQTCTYVPSAGWVAKGQWLTGQSMAHRADAALSLSLGRWVKPHRRFVYKNLARPLQFVIRDKFEEQGGGMLQGLEVGRGN